MSEYTRIHLKKNGRMYSLASCIERYSADMKSESLAEQFSGIPNEEHRREEVAEIGGVLYINDSKATNVNAGWFSLECMERPVIWIMGGAYKGCDFTKLTDVVRSKVRSTIVLAVDADPYKNAVVWPSVVIEVKTMDHAVNYAKRIARKGDVILFSPCAASFDLFKDYEDRGRQFKECVRKL